MIVAFFGHSKICEANKDKILFNLFEHVSLNEEVTFFLGGYGVFDNLALLACAEFKLKNKRSELCFVTLYLDNKYLKRKIALGCYDRIIFPDLENVPKKYAVIRRNYWMVKKADFIVAYVKHSWGGAAKALEYAKKLKKDFVNIAE